MNNEVTTITRDMYKAYLKELHRYGMVEGYTNYFIHTNIQDIEKAFKGTNIKSITI